jgi:DMSO/TMAO reductase YedYZ molybdopterin-dependent catalytic subunit
VRAAVVGLVAAAALEAVARLVGGLLGAPSPVVAVGDAVVRLSPPALTSLAIRLFGTYDKTVLLGVIVLAVTALAAAAGVVARTRPAAGAAIAAVLVAVGAAAALTGPVARPADALPVLAGAAVAFPLLVVGTRRLAPPRAVGASDTGPGTGSAAPARPLSRRAFLLAAGTAAASVAAVAVAGRALARRARDAVASRAGLRLPTAPDPAPPQPAGAGVSPLTPFRTPNADFYRIDTALSVPQLPAEDWSLRVHGLVERELRLGWSDLTSRRALERWITLVCVSNEVGGELAGNAVWRGISLADLLAEAGPDPDADMVLSTSVDGYTASTPLETLLESPDALLAYGMNGEPLPLEHGFPVRMVVPGLYGYVSATKWVVDLEVTRFADATAFWTPRGYSERAPVKVASRIDVPRSFEEVAAGRVAVAGVAWSPGPGIEAVEVRVDGGDWQPATLAEVPAPTTWRQWSWAWDATPGSHTLEVRATDSEGTTQTGERAPIKPDGATGWHSVVVRVA